VNLSSIRRHVFRKLPILQQLKVKISLSTIHRQMLPPNRRNKASKYYQSLVRAKIPAKKNNLRLHDDDAHYYFARMKLLRNFNAHFSDNCVEISCDNKNKVHVGTLATNRLISVKKFFAEGDAPAYNDHDFPLGYKITPMGYMLLNPDSAKPTKTHDESGRAQYKFSQSGRLFVINRAQKFHSSTVEPHINDLLKIFQTEKISQTILTLIVDNGPDWSSSSLTNCLFLHRLFLQLNLDVLFVASFCPKFSAFNPIEHSWSACTRAITSVTLPATLPGETVPPCSQKMSETARLNKESIMFDRAMRILCSHWDKITYSGQKVISLYQPCFQKNSPYSDYAQIKQKMASTACISRDENLMDELESLRAHMDRRIDLLCFKKCSENFCAHCVKNPVSATHAFDFLRKNVKFPNPELSSSTEKQFKTFFDVLNFGEAANIRPDQFMSKRYLKLAAKIGNIHCGKCKYMFLSLSDKKNHMKIYHR